MSKDIVIRIENLSKLYRLGLVSTGTMAHDLNRFWAKIRGKDDPFLKIGETNDRSSKGDSDYVWALKDINFEVKRGDRIGIIGKNGAGKSTLLKILSEVTGPTKGSIKMKGRIGALLEVGTGFHLELTGRENIYMNGTILGMSHREVSKKLDEIVDFAGVERYIDTPVKRYSSGMMVRLGFAVAAHLEPDILVVDEVLAVGDAEFQKKAIGKMKDVSEGHGRTILFVSHNMTAVRELCNLGVVLANGQVQFKETSLNAVNFYINNECISHNKSFSEYQNNYIAIKQVKILPVNQDIITIDSGIIFKLVFLNKKSNINIDFTLELINEDDVIVFHTFTFISKNKDSQVGEYTVQTTFPKYLLNAGTYRINVIFGENQRHILYKQANIFAFDVQNIAAANNMNRLPGVIWPKFNWDLSFIK